MFDLPEFLQPDEPFPAADLDNEAGGFAGATEIARVANVTGMIAQEEDNWCWAAVTQYVLRLVRGHMAAQQDIATAHVQHNGRTHTCAFPKRRETSGQCAGGPCSGDCNAQHALRTVLRENGFSADYLSRRAAPSFDEIRGEIGAGRPVPCRVRWNATAGHFVLVTGCMIDGDGEPVVHVRDPDTAARGQPIPELIMSHSKFIGRYQTSGPRGTINFSYKVT